MRPPQISDTKRLIRPFVRRCAEQEIRHLVVLSVLRANPAMPHWHIERDVRAAGLPHSFVRSGYFAQNLEEALRCDIVDRDRIRLAAGNGVTAFIDAHDVSEVIAGLLTGPGRDVIYSLTGPQAITWNAVAAQLSDELPHHHLPARRGARRPTRAPRRWAGDRLRQYPDRHQHRGPTRSSCAGRR